MASRGGDVRRAGIVGVNWGLVHLRGLREAGCEVVAIAATDASTAREVAAREAVPLGTGNVAELDDLDVVVIATPAATHAQVIAQLPRPYLICEKPLLGLGGSPGQLPDVHQRMLVNYAFPFLRTGEALSALVAEHGPPARVTVRVSANLPLPLSPAQWFLEAASHPVSWVLHTLGRPAPLSFSETEDAARSGFTAGGAAVAAEMLVGGPAGIHQAIELEWAGLHARAAGRYIPGRPWEYDSVTVDGTAVTPGERSSSDPWFDANAAAVRQMISAFRGELDWEAALRGGLFDADKALWLESLLPGWPRT